jgi:hypothetical protein
VSSTVDVKHHFKDPLDLEISPTTFGLNLDVTHIADIPKITIGVDPITINPVDVSVRLKEIPSIRTHIPANFAIGLSVLGYDVACVRLCGEAQVITEPYHPNLCEICGQAHRTPVPRPAPDEDQVPK